MARILVSVALATIALSGVCFAQTGTGQVRHAPTVNGSVQGSLQQMLAEGVSFNSGASLTGSLYVPGSPAVQLNGSPTYGGTLDGTGAATPANYSVTLNSSSTLGHVVRRTDALTWPTLSAVPNPSGTASVAVNSAGQSINWTTLRNLTLNSGVGQVVVPAGAYGDFTANSNAGFTLGVAGAATPAVYNFQSLTLNSAAKLLVVGPVTINVANGFTLNGTAGEPAQPSWLALNLRTAGLTLNSGAKFYGYLVAPAGTATINSSAQFVGGLTSDRLTVNSGGVLKLQSASTPNQSPTVALTAPANGGSYTAPAAFTLTATAADTDGTVAKVEFYNGTTKLGEDATAPYSLALSGVAVGSYSYYARATDNAGASTDSTAAAVSVTAANQPPTVVLTSPLDGATVTGPIAINLAATAADADGTVSRVDFYQGTMLLTSDGTAPYTAVTGTLAPGGYTFTAQAVDNLGVVTTSTAVSITVLTPNQAPTVNITAPADGTSYADTATFNVEVTAADTDGFVAKVELRRNGAVVAEDTSAPFAFTVTGLAAGTYDFVARATDNGGTATDSTAVRLTIAHVNQVPVGIAQAASTPEDTAVTVVLAGVDPDGDELTYEIVQQPSHGSLEQVAANTYRYTPAVNSDVDDQFTFVARDAELSSAPALVTIDVVPVNDPPVALAGVLVLDEDSVAGIHLGAVDVDSPLLNYQQISTPEHGELSGEAPNLTYHPAHNYFGPDVFTFRVADEQSIAAPATVSITVRPINDAPVARAATINVAKNGAVSFPLEATDDDGDSLSYELVASPLHGTIAGAPPNLTYTPLAGYEGDDILTFRAGDGIDFSSVATIAIVVQSQNRPPVSSDVTIVTRMNQSVSFAPTGSDPDGDALIFSFSGGEHGAVVADPDNGGYLYVPDALYVGTDIVTFTVSDGEAAPVAYTLSVTVTNQPPIALSASYGAVEDTPVEITLSAADPDGQSLTYTIVESPARGTLEATSQAGVFRYIPYPETSGSDVFAFTATDGLAVSVPATAQINVGPVNDAPVAEAMALVLYEGGSTSATLTGRDVDSSDLSISIGGQPQHGVILGIPPAITYKSNAGYVGSDTFTYVVSDGHAASTPATVSVEIVPRPVIITSPAPGFTAAATVEVTGLVNVAADVVKVNGVTASLAAGAFTASVPVLEGSNTLTAVVTSGGGGVFTASVNITRDTQAPRVAIDSPSPDWQTDEPVVTVTGIINDTVIGTVNSEQATVSVNGVEAIVRNRTFRAENVPLAIGGNTLVASASDRAGNTGTAGVAVVRRAGALAGVHLLAGDNQRDSIGSPLAIPLQVLVSDEGGAPLAGRRVIFKVLQNDGQLSAGDRVARSVIVTSDANGHASAAYRLGSRVGEGNHQVQAMVVGLPREVIFRASATPGPPALLVSDSGTRQSAAPDSPLPKPFVAIAVDDGGNRLANVPITFSVAEGGGSFAGDPATTVFTDSDGRALVTLTTGPEEGVENNRVYANFAGNPGAPAVFVASAITPGPAAETSISGVVLDNSDVPVPGATIRINGTNLVTTSDAQGQFRIKPAPVGTVRLDVYGDTVTRPGTWVNLDFSITTVSGRDNTIGMPVRLLPLALENSVAVGTNYGGTITLPDFPGFSLTVAPNSVTFPGGSHVGNLSVTVVHTDKTPEVPGFGQQPRFIVSINPKRALISPPARICFPNLDGLPPGRKTELYSFDEDLDAFVAIGTGTVSEDGTQVCSDPGIGVIKGGWHCGGDPEVTAGVARTTVNVRSDDMMFFLFKGNLRLKLNTTGRIYAKGAPGAPSGTLFEWRKNQSTIPQQIQGDVEFTHVDAGDLSTATVKATQAGLVRLEVRYRCKSGQWSDYAPVDINVDAILMKVADRDDPLRPLEEAESREAGKTVYAGSESGDLISWRVATPAVMFNPPTFTWSAKGPDGTVIAGPTGVGKAEWQISDEDDDDSADWLNWKPGVYKITCRVVSPDGSASSDITFEQTVGWRTESWLVIGQVVQTVTHSNDAPPPMPTLFQANGEVDPQDPTYLYRLAVIKDSLGAVRNTLDLVGFYTMAAENAKLASMPLPINGKLAELWAGVWTVYSNFTLPPQGPFEKSFPTGEGQITERQRFWMVQHIFNISYDQPTVDDTLTEDRVLSLKRAKAFRILHRFQGKFEIETNGLIKAGSFKPVDPLYDAGSTKANIGLDPGEFLPYWNNPGLSINVAKLEPETNPLSVPAGRVRGNALSSYYSARVAKDGRSVNYHLAGSDAPWIFSEIIFETQPDRTVSTRLRTSVDIRWKDGHVVSGQTPFNNLNIYKRTVVDGDILYRRQGNVLSMEGQIEPFVKSVPHVWDLPPLPPEVYP